jgi:hypothetical protein
MLAPFVETMELIGSDLEVTDNLLNLFLNCPHDCRANGVAVVRGAVPRLHQRVVVCRARPDC